LCLYENSLHASTNEVIINRTGEKNCVYNKTVMFPGIVFRISSVLDYIVTTSFGYIFYCGCFNLFFNVWVSGQYVYLYLLCFVLFVLCFL